MIKLPDINHPVTDKEMDKEWYGIYQNIVTAINDLSTSVTALDTRITTLESDVSTLQSDVSSLQVTVADHESRITALETP